MLGTPCLTGDVCASGYCVDGVCCDEACGGGALDDCLGCSVAVGASTDGTCAPFDGIPCDDGLHCNGVDTCQVGTCSHAGDPCPGADGDGDCAESCDESTDSCTADDFDGAKQMTAKIVGWDGRGVRPGLFRIQWLTDWSDSALAEAPGFVHAVVRGVGEYGMLIVLILGLAYHWTPRRWVDEILAERFRRLPGPVIGLAFALLGLCLMHLLAGPRANIYFAF